MYSCVKQINIVTEGNSKRDPLVFSTTTADGG